MQDSIKYKPSAAGVCVYLGGRRVGIIKKVTGGFAYFPKGHSAGETFPTVEAVKRSIEA